MRTSREQPQLAQTPGSPPRTLGRYRVVTELGRGSTSIVYLGAVDFAGHATGSGTAYRAALLAADQRVGRLVAAVRSRPSGPAEGWTIVVVTDHGHLDEGGHGGREPEVTTAWAAAAGPGIRPGAPPLIARQEEVARLVLAAAGCPEHRG